MENINIIEFLWVLFTSSYTGIGINNAIQKSIKTRNKKKRITPFTSEEW